MDGVFIILIFYSISRVMHYMVGCRPTTVYRAEIAVYKMYSYKGCNTCSHARLLPLIYLTFR